MDRSCIIKQAIRSLKKLDYNGRCQYLTLCGIRSVLGEYMVVGIMRVRL